MFLYRSYYDKSKYRLWVTSENLDVSIKEEDESSRYKIMNKPNIENITKKERLVEKHSVDLKNLHIKYKTLKFLIKSMKQKRDHSGYESFLNG